MYIYIYIHTRLLQYRSNTTVSFHNFKSLVIELRMIIVITNTSNCNRTMNDNSNTNYSNSNSNTYYNYYHSRLSRLCVWYVAWLVIHSCAMIIIIIIRRLSTVYPCFVIQCLQIHVSSISSYRLRFIRYSAMWYIYIYTHIS